VRLGKKTKTKTKNSQYIWFTLYSIISDCPLSRYISLLRSTLKRKRGIFTKNEDSKLRITFKLLDPLQTF